MLFALQVTRFGDQVGRSYALSEENRSLVYEKVAPVAERFIAEAIQKRKDEKRPFPPEGVQSYCCEVYNEQGIVIETFAAHEYLSTAKICRPKCYCHLCRCLFRLGDILQAG